MSLTQSIATFFRPSDLAKRVETLHSQLEEAQARIETLSAQRNDFETRLHESDDRAKARSELLYDIEKHYSSEHFSLQESMRNLNIERMRNAGAFADREVILERAVQLQERIKDLKIRLRVHEDVEDLYFDDAPIVSKADGAR